MPAKRTDRQDVTPAGQLAESKLHFVLGYQLAQAAIVTNSLFQRHAGDPFDLRPVEYTVLTLIAENPGGSQARLARALAVTAPHVTAIVDRLEEKKLIERTRSEHDRRSQTLHATKKGVDTARRATQGIVDAERSTLTSLTAGEQMILVELLHKVACARPAASG